MNESSEEERGNTTTLRNVSLFSSTLGPLIHPRPAVLSFLMPLIDINDTEQHDPILFFHQQPRARFFPDQCPVSSILITLL